MLGLGSYSSSDEEQDRAGTRQSKDGRVEVCIADGVEHRSLANILDARLTELSRSPLLGPIGQTVKTPWPFNVLL